MDSKQKGERMQKTRFFALVVLGLILVLLLASIVEAGPVQRIDKFFKNNEYKQHDKLIDFLLFFTLFFSVCYLGFSKWFGEGFGRPGAAKNVVVGLSFALSLALAFAVVISTDFSVASLLPIAKNLVFAIIVILFYGIFSNPAMIGNDNWVKKIMSFAMAVAVAYIFLNVFTWGVCNIEGNAGTAPCKSGFFNAAGYGVDWLFGGGGGTTAGTTADGSKTAEKGGKAPSGGNGTAPGPTQPGGPHLQRVTNCPIGSSNWYAWENDWGKCDSAGCAAETRSVPRITDATLIKQIEDCEKNQPKQPGISPGQGTGPGGAGDAAALQAEVTALEQELTNAEIELKSAKDQSGKDVAKGKIQSIKARLEALRTKIQNANIP
ncbi:hypothetical protein HY772_01730 [Candidatus Woesearchaeota archaeon]|nr:hypothetical protein [Candidatus Woesearchaeota archaeon]